MLSDNFVDGAAKLASVIAGLSGVDLYPGALSLSITTEDVDVQTRVTSVLGGEFGRLNGLEDGDALG
jgi:hypothetical protein